MSSPSTRDRLTDYRRLPRDASQSRAIRCSMADSATGARLRLYTGGSWLRSSGTCPTAGLRRAEVLGLRWSKVDLDRRRIRIAQTITEVRGKLVVQADGNSDAAERSIGLDAHTPEPLRRGLPPLDRGPRAASHLCHGKLAGRGLPREGRRTPRSRLGGRGSDQGHSVFYGVLRRSSHAREGGLQPPCPLGHTARNRAEAAHGHTASSSRKWPKRSGWPIQPVLTSITHRGCPRGSRTSPATFVSTSCPRTRLHAAGDGCG